MGLGMLVGCHVVVVRDPDVLRETEDSEQHQAAGRRREPVAGAAQEVVRQRADAREDGEIAVDQRRERNAEEPEPEGVQIRRERTVPIGDVPIERLALRQPPGEVELEAEVDLYVGPLPPAPPGEQREGSRDRERSDPAGEERPHRE